MQIQGLIIGLLSFPDHRGVPPHRHPGGVPLWQPDLAGVSGGGAAAGGPLHPGGGSAAFRSAGDDRVCQSVEHWRTEGAGTTGPPGLVPGEPPALPAGGRCPQGTAAGAVKKSRTGRPPNGCPVPGPSSVDPAKRPFRSLGSRAVPAAPGVGVCGVRFCGGRLLLPGNVGVVHRLGAVDVAPVPGCSCTK